MENKRSHAKAAGDRLYFTGKVCRNGHLAARYTATGVCRGCLREAGRAPAAAGVNRGTVRVPVGSWGAFLDVLWAMGLEAGEDPIVRSVRCPEGLADTLRAMVDRLGEGS